MSPALVMRKRDSDSSQPPALSKEPRSSSLRIGSPSDALEREADRVAEAVTSNANAPNWSLHKVRFGQVQRQPAPDPGPTQDAPSNQPTTSPKPNNYTEGASKLGEAFLQTDIGKKLKDAASQDPLVKGAEDFIGTLPGKIIAGTAAAGAVTALAATHKALPAQIPEIPLDVVRPGLKVKIDYEGPVDRPTKAMITFSYTPKSDTKKPAQTDQEKYRAETACMAADQEKFRAGLKYAPGSPEAKQQAADQKMMDDFLAKKLGTLPGTGRRPLVPGLGASGQASGSQWSFSPLAQPDQGQKLDPTPSSAPSGTLQRKCACDQNGAGGECEECKKQKETMQRKAAMPAELDTGPPLVDQVLQSSGQPLDRATRAFFEPRFGYDFSHVRVHTDSRASESARAVNALAYTVGGHIAFGAGRFSPADQAGRRLLAHELAHVTQQDGASTALVQRQPVQVGLPQPDECEGRADITKEFNDFIKDLPSLLASAPDFTPEQKASFKGEFDRFLRPEAGVNIKTFKVVSCDKINSDLMVAGESAQAEVDPNKKEIRLSKYTKQLIDDCKQKKDKAPLGQLLETLAHEKRHVTLGSALKVDPKNVLPGRSDSVANKAEYRAQEILAVAEEIAVGRMAFGPSFSVQPSKQEKLRRQSNMIKNYVTEDEYKRLRSIVIAKLRERYGFEHGCDNQLTVGVVSSMDHNRWYECISGAPGGIVPTPASDLHICDDFCKRHSPRPGKTESEEGPDEPQKEGVMLSPKSADPAAFAPEFAPPIVGSVLQSVGRPLDSATRAYFEPRFEHDFSRVRVHTDAQAAESARGVNALAYTVGDRIAFAADRYAPHTSEGRQLLAHELAHTVQQSSVERSLGSPLAIGEADGPHEGAAEAAARNIHAGRAASTPVPSAGLSRPSLQRAPDPVSADTDLSATVSRLEQIVRTGGSVPTDTRTICAVIVDVEGYKGSKEIRAISALATDPLGQGAPVEHAQAPAPGTRTLSATRSIAGGGARREFPFSHINDAEMKAFELIVRNMPKNPKGSVHFLTMRVRQVGGNTVFEPMPACSGCTRATFEMGNFKGVNMISHAAVHPTGTLDMGGESPQEPGAKKPTDQGSGGGGEGARGGGESTKSGTSEGGGKTSSLPSLAPLAEGVETRPASSAEIITRQRVISQLEAETAESVRISGRLQAAGAVVGGLLQIYTAINTVDDALKFAADGTKFPAEQRGAENLEELSKEDLENERNVTNGVSLLLAVAAINDARERGDQKALFDLGESIGDFASAYGPLAEQLTDRYHQLDARMKGLDLMEHYFDKMMRLPVDPLAGTIPQSQAFMIHESIVKITGPFRVARDNYKEASETLKYYVDYTSSLAHEANSSAWTLAFRRFAEAAKKSAAPGGTAAPVSPQPGAHATPPNVHLGTSPQGFPTEAEQKGKGPCPSCHSPNTPSGPPSNAASGQSGLFKPPTDKELVEMAKQFYK